MGPRIINTSICRLTVVTFSKFLDTVQKFSVRPEDGKYATFYVPGSVYGISSMDSLYCTEVPWTREVVELHKLPNFKIRDEFLRFELLNKVKMIDLSNKSLDYQLQDSICSFVDQQASYPTHLVRVCSRLWLLANPKDFTIPISESGWVGLFIANKDKNIVYSIHKGEPKTFKILGQN